MLGLHLSHSSFPVGKVSLEYLYPMDFEEYSEALGISSIGIVCTRPATCAIIRSAWPMTGDVASAAANSSTAASGSAAILTITGTYCPGICSGTWVEAYRLADSVVNQETPLRSSGSPPMDSVLTSSKSNSSLRVAESLSRG